MRRVLNASSPSKSLLGVFPLAWLTAVACATAEPLPEVEPLGEGGATGGATGGAMSGGQSSGGTTVPGTGGFTFAQGGAQSLGGGGTFARGGSASGASGAPSSGGKSSGGSSSGGTAGTATKGGAGTGGTLGSGGSAGAIAKGGAPAGGTSSGGATAAGGSGGVSGKGGAAGSAGAAGGSAKGELFFDDFETGKASRWVQSPAGSDWAVVADGSNVYKEQTRTGAQRLTVAGDSTWGDQVVEAKIKILEFAGQSTSYYASLCARVRDAENFYSVTLSSDGKLAFRVNAGGSLSKVGTQYTVPGGVLTNVWYTVRLEVRGNALSAYLNGTLAASHTVASNAIATGGVGLSTYNAIAEFDDVRVTAP